MSDFPENADPNGPVEAARRTVRKPALHRFYRTVETKAEGSDFCVHLDGKPAHTPAGRILAAPTAPLAQAIAAEWQAQGDLIDPATMPLTRLANGIIDGVSDRAGAVTAEVKKYLASDLICYRATSPQKLVALQSQHWDPIVEWAAETLGAQFLVTDGVIHVAQPEPALAAAAVAIPPDAWRLGAVHAATTLSGSVLIALALAKGRLSADEAWAAAHVDEDWNIAQWGEDELAMQRRAFRLAEFQAAARVLQSH
ncbi:MAG TPA: ATP12 family protein [Xanthobacteraceae bacterium]|jgi:chaperone required for assembly of F1-ATPase